jgi:hypothetical protein
MKGARWLIDVKNRRYVGNPTLRRAFGFLDRRADLKGLPLFRMTLFGRGTDQKLTNVGPSEAVMDGSRSERARVRNTFWLKSHRYLMTLNFSAYANYP